MTVTSWEELCHVLLMQYLIQDKLVAENILILAWRNKTCATGMKQGKYCTNLEDLYAK